LSSSVGWTGFPLLKTMVSSPAWDGNFLLQLVRAGAIKYNLIVICRAKFWGRPLPPDQGCRWLESALSPVRMCVGKRFSKLLLTSMIAVRRSLLKGYIRSCVCLKRSVVSSQRSDTAPIRRKTQVQILPRCPLACKGARCAGPRRNRGMGPRRA
jgi:hypothetical protein